MNLSDLESHQSIQDDRRATDPAYAAEMDRLALADAVSVVVVSYRTIHKLSQTEFAKKLGWKQPHVARLERGDVAPSLESLQRLARAGVIEVQVKRQGTIVKSAVVKRSARSTVSNKSMQPEKPRSRISA